MQQKRWLAWIMVILMVLGGGIPVRNVQAASPKISKTSITLKKGKSKTLKKKCSAGTAGKWSKLSEYELNLTVSLQLRKELEKRGYQTA